MGVGVTGDVGGGPMDSRLRGNDVVGAGMTWEGVGVMRVVLSQYDVSTIVTGRLYGDWGAVRHVHSMR